MISLSLSGEAEHNNHSSFSLIQQQLLTSSKHTSIQQLYHNIIFIAAPIHNNTHASIHIIHKYHSHISQMATTATTDFYLRYYIGHKGRFGHEFLEFEVRPDGMIRYANNSNYRREVLIRKEGKETTHNWQQCANDKRNRQVSHRVK